MNKSLIVGFLALVVVSGLDTGCSKKKNLDCIGTPSCEGEWKVFAGHVGEGKACTTPAGDLHVRYEKRTSDELVDLWSKLVQTRMGLEIEKTWRANQEYREAVYKSTNGEKYLIVQIVQTSGTRIRTVRLTWESIHSDYAKPSAEGVSGPSCAFIHNTVKRLVETAPVIKLSKEPLASEGALGAGEGMPCNGFGDVKAALLASKTTKPDEVVLGVLSGQRVAVARQGPAGSGRFWEVSIAVQTKGGVIGGCISASTTAWRNISRFANRFGEWDLIAKDNSGQERMILWWSVESHPSASNASYVLVPLAYRLDGNRLVIDSRSTLEEIATFGTIYLDIADSDDSWASTLHRAAGLAHKSLAAKTACPL